MSELFPTAAAPAPEPAWLANARRRDKQISASTSITATDRRLLLAALDAATARATKAESRADELLAEADRVLQHNSDWQEAHTRERRRADGLQQELADQETQKFKLILALESHGLRLPKGVTQPPAPLPSSPAAAPPVAVIQELCPAYRQTMGCFCAKGTCVLAEQENAAAATTTGEGKEAALTSCCANRDGECYAAGCPQLRDNEPHATGRFCPLPDEDDD